jgi:hypothetical protein
MKPEERERVMVLPPHQLVMKAPNDAKVDRGAQTAQDGQHYQPDKKDSHEFEEVHDVSLCHSPCGPCSRRARLRFFFNRTMIVGWHERRVKSG